MFKWLPSGDSHLELGTPHHPSAHSLVLVAALMKAPDIGNDMGIGSNHNLAILDPLVKGILIRQFVILQNTWTSPEKKQKQLWIEMLMLVNHSSICCFFSIPILSGSILISGFGRSSQPTSRNQPKHSRLKSVIFSLNRHNLLQYHHFWTDPSLNCFTRPQIKHTNVPYI